jgi:hypothetical protein
VTYMAVAAAAATRLAALRVDHLVYAVPGLLEDACADFARRTGVTPSPGGVHKGLGTHNALAALGGGAYLEILARDPGQPSPERTWMAIDTVTEPCIVTWASKHENLPLAVDKARQQGYDPGKVESFSRPDPGSGEELRWELAYNHYKQPLPGSGVVPFLISCELPRRVWLASWCVHATHSHLWAVRLQYTVWTGDPACAEFLPPNTAAGGCTLLGLRAETPVPDEVSPVRSYAKFVVHAILR